MRVINRHTFEHALDRALAYLWKNDANAAAQALVDSVLTRLPQRLSRFPRMGRDYLGRNPETPEVLAALEQVRILLGADIELREVILDDYLALYAIHGETVHLLTLRHHRQSGFDFSGM